MRISKPLHIAAIWVVPALFCATAGGLQAVYFKSSSPDRTTVSAARILAADAVSEAAPGLRDLEQASRGGDLAARLEIARRLAAGEGVKRDEARAFAYFQSIANQYSDIDPRERRASQISEAFRLLARFYRRGVAGANISPDPAYAASLLHYSASYFGDPVSQFELAKLMLSGDGVSKNPHVAAQWLMNASRKGYSPAQALLGDLLWRGDGVARSPGDGLGLLSIARRTASAADKAWVERLFEHARAEATLSEVLEANAFVAQEANSLHWPLTDDLLVESTSESNPAAVGSPAEKGKPKEPSALAATQISGDAVSGPVRGATSPTRAVRYAPRSSDLSEAAPTGEAVQPQ